MPLQIKVAYAYPHRMRSVEAGDGSGRLFKELVPGSPTRPARVTDDSTWWEDVPDDPSSYLAARLLFQTGCSVREV